MEVDAAVWWTPVIERQDVKLDLIKASVAAKTRKEDLAMLLVDTSGMDDNVGAWCMDPGREESSTATQGEQRCSAGDLDTTGDIHSIGDREPTGDRGFIGGGAFYARG
jgi:hypothetical protein